MTGKRPLTAQEDLAESKRRAKTARTPIAKTVTKQVVEKKERVYSGQAAREHAAQMRRGVHQPTVATTPKSGTGLATPKPRAARVAKSGSAVRMPQKTKTARSKRASQ